MLNHVWQHFISSLNNVNRRILKMPSRSKIFVHKFLISERRGMPDEHSADQRKSRRSTNALKMMDITSEM